MTGLAARHTRVTGTAFLLLAALTACSPVAPSPSTAITTVTASPASTAAPAPSPTPVTGLQAVNGTQLYYAVIGQGAPLFVLHGSSGSHRYFLPYLEPLSNGFQLVFYDQRGTGLSDGHIDLAALTIGQFVEDLEALRVSLGFEKISLMGHSRGALIALAYAAKYQAHLDHLILVDSIPVGRTFAIALSDTLQQRFQHLSADAQNEWTTTCGQPLSAQSAKAIDACNQIDAQLRFYDPSKAATVDWGEAGNTLKNSDTVGALINNSFDRVQPAIDAQLPTLHVPTLIVHGDYDPIPLASSQYLQQHIPGSQIVVVPHSGHFPFIEQPEQFVAALRTFLSR